MTIDDRTVLGGHGEDVAAGFEDTALAGRRDRGVADQRLYARDPRMEREPVGDDFNLHFVGLLGREIEQIEAPARLKHDVVGPIAGNVMS